MSCWHAPCLALMYHNVCETSARSDRGRHCWRGFERLSPSITSYFVDTETFEQHCRAIAEKAISGGEKSPRVVLTFDDGWRGSVEIAGPILERFGLRALLFVTTDLIGHPLFVDREQLQKLPAPFEVGSHARTHRRLAELSTAEVWTELRDSKSQLEDIIGREVAHIAYPGGSFDPRVLQMTWDAGYRTVFTSQPRINRLDVGSGALDDERKPSTARARPTDLATDSFLCAPATLPGINRETAPGVVLGRLAVKSTTPLCTLERWLTGDIRRESWKASGLGAAKFLMGRSSYAWLRRRLLVEEDTHLEMTDLAARALEFVHEECRSSSTPPGAELPCSC